MVVAWVIRYNCVAPFATAALLCQETSSVFLNYFLAPARTHERAPRRGARPRALTRTPTAQLFRNRTRHWSNTAAFLAFALNFLVFRIGARATRTSVEIIYAHIHARVVPARTGIGTFTSYHFLRHFRDALPPAVMASMHLLACCLVVATVLQWYWGFAIVKMATGTKGKKKD